jgi:hypothetical protein
MGIKPADLMIFVSSNTSDFPLIYKIAKVSKIYIIWSPKIFQYEDHVQWFGSVVWISKFEIKTQNTGCFVLREASEPLSLSFSICIYIYLIISQYKFFFLFMLLAGGRKNGTRSVCWEDWKAFRFLYLLNCFLLLLLYLEYILLKVLIIQIK